MEDCTKEKFIRTSPDPVSFEGTQNILNQMNNCVCRIYNNGEGTGFFTKIPYKKKLFSALITNNHVISINDIINNKLITLYLNNDKKERSIKLDNNRLRYTNEKLDITIIEIKDKDNINNKYLELDDNIIDYFELEEKEDPNYLNNIYSNKSIYIINYHPEDKNSKSIIWSTTKII